MSSKLWNMVARLAARPAARRWLIARAERTPYTHIYKGDKLYMRRFWLFNPYPDTGASGADRPRWQFPISIRIHHIVRPDQDRHDHDHPWNARTIILAGSYVEQRSGITYIRQAGDTATLKFGEYHSITQVSIGGAWTMFIIGPYRGTWGFLVDGVKVHWRKYLRLGETK